MRYDKFESPHVEFDELFEKVVANLSRTEDTAVLCSPPKFWRTGMPEKRHDDAWFDRAAKSFVMSLRWAAIILAVGGALGYVLIYYL